MLRLVSALRRAVWSGWRPGSRRLPLKRKDGTVVAHTRVDEADYEALNRWRWHLTSEGYAARSHRVGGRSRTVYMHREVCCPPQGLIVDHINRDRLDNRRANLRAVTRSQNNANSARRPSSTGYKGAYPHRSTGRYQAQISQGGRRRSLGLFDAPEEAAAAYDRAALELYGPLAAINGVLVERAPEEEEGTG